MPTVPPIPFAATGIPRPAAAYLRPEALAAEYDVDIQSVRNWIIQGVPLRGRVVKLRAVRVGRLWRIPREAWEEFLAALNDGPVRTAEGESNRRKRHADAMRELELELDRGKRKR